jgi:hypothetical protein
MEITFSELAAEAVELLPAREALGVGNVALIGAYNASAAANVLTVLSAAASQANQAIVVFQ